MALATFSGVIRLVVPLDSCPTGAHLPQVLNSVRQRSYWARSAAVSGGATGAGEAGAGLLGAFVEDGENFFAILAVGHFDLLAAWRDVEIIGLEHGGGPAGHHGDVVREPAHRAGLGVGLIVQLVVGDALEGFAGVGKFLIEFS